MANKQETLIEEHITALFQLSRALKKYADLSGEKLPISPLQMHALFFVRENDKTTMTNLSDCFGVALPTTTKLVEKLVNVQLIERFPDPKDRRIIHLTLTKKGQKMLHDMIEQMNKPLRKLLAKIPEKDLAQLNRITNELLLKVEELKNE